MALTIDAEPIPLQIHADGIVRVGGTRVTLDSFVAAFGRGAMAEEIVQQYPSVSLADAYAVIAYYLRRRSDVEDYLQRRRDQASAIRRDIEGRFDPEGVRDSLLARRGLASLQAESRS